MLNYLKYIILYSLCFLAMVGNLHAQLQINEFMASNDETLFDPDYNDDADWIELYNASDSPLIISGYYISDDKDNPQKWMVSHVLTIDPKSYVLFWADGKNTGVHTNFKLGAEGEFIGIYNPLGELIDSVTFGKQRTNVSYGRKNDTSTSWYYFSDPTPGTTNNTTTFSGIATRPQITPEGGFFTTTQSVTITSPVGAAFFRYTLDGKEPNSNSPVYFEPLDINNTTVIRAIAFQSGMLPSEPVNKTFFIDEPDHELPVFSISSAPGNFWDTDTGFYVNYNDDIEVPVGVEFFEDGSQAFQLNAGAEIYGGATRGFAQKSLDIKIRHRYGNNELNYRFFENNPRKLFTSFLLRNSGNDWAYGGNALGTMFCDGLQQSIIENTMDIDMQSYRPSVVYINGSYWGIYNLREKLDNDYAAYYHDNNPDSIDMIKIGAGDVIDVMSGDTIHFSNMVNLLETKDMSNDSNYAYIKTQMDVSEFMNYQITQNFNANIDWPHNNNKFYRPQRDDGKWRWMLYDLDFGFNGFKFVSWPEWTGYKRDMYPRTLDTAADKWSTEILRNLIDNQDFVNEFVQRYAHHLNTTFETQRTLSFINNIKGQLADEIPRHSNRWGDDGAVDSYSAWQSNINKYTQFAQLRPGYAWQYTMDQFGLYDTTTLTLTIINHQGGTVCVNDIPVEEDSLTGNYFENIPLRLTANAYAGYAFVGWEEDTTSTNDSLILFLNKPVKIRAVFEKYSPLFINEVCASNTHLIPDEFDEYDDWVEIYNPSDSAIDLGGLYLTDNFNDPFKWMIPENDPATTTIDKNNFLVFWLDGQPYQGANHADFKLDKNGEQIGLVEKRGIEAVYIDSFSFSMQTVDVTYGRFPDGINDFYFFDNPTPFAANDSTSNAIQEFDMLSTENFTLYPNPTNADFTIGYKNEINSTNNFRIDLLDVNGIILFSDNIENIDNYRIDVSSYSNGLYFVKIYLPNQIIIKKLIKY